MNRNCPASAFFLVVAAADADVAAVALASVAVLTGAVFDVHVVPSSTLLLAPA